MQAGTASGAKGSEFPRAFQNNADEHRSTYEVARVLRGTTARLLLTEPFNVGDPTQSPHRRDLTLDYLERRKSGTMDPGFGVLGLAPC